MEKHYYFDRNLLALSAYNDALCKRLSAAETTLSRYRFVESRNGNAIPAWVDATGAAHTLHSLIAPEREAERFCSTLTEEGYLVLLGLGGGYFAEAVLERDTTHKILVIDYDIHAIAELFCSCEYVHILNDPRVTLLVDPDVHTIINYIIETYHPCVHNGIRLIPLRGRCDFDEEHFLPAADAVKQAIDLVSSDYSVQAHFGMRWFSNIIRNVVLAEKQHGIIAPVSHAAVCAAGPSLDIQLNELKKRREELFIISTDTALGALLSAGIVPQALISIDCQHISYLHFMCQGIAALREHTTLFVDLASPPLLALSLPKSFFFSGGHPLVRYITSNFKEFITLDTSGGNVTYAGIALAEKLGAKTIELYGADFAYPDGMAYSKGAYFYPFLNRLQNRFSPVSAQLAGFLFNIPSLRYVKCAHDYYYETRSLEMYRKRLEEKAQNSNACFIAMPGKGAPIQFPVRPNVTRPFDTTIKLFSGGRTFTGAKNFLSVYRRNIAELPVPERNIESYFQQLSASERTIFTTFLPTAAALKQRKAIKENDVLFHAVKSFCTEKIDKVLKSAY
ncbi:MAG: DUF115 domain-containing protein [Spirochaetaceae bacterium]|jgi:hypothetical protein|nr:DUF115 domain-containing protein [Spirochaetaceae bacterium]